MIIDVAIPGWMYKVALGITIASAIANILPKSDFLAGFPTAKKIYEVIIAGIAITAMNIRSYLPGLNLPFLGFPKSLPPSAVEELKKKVTEVEKK